MPKDDSLKSAYELAMERLRAQDREAGVEAPKTLNRQQKQKIAELRRKTEAKLAEMKILLEKNLTAAQGDPEKTRELEEHYQIDRRRAESDLESKIAQVKQG